MTLSPELMMGFVAGLLVMIALIVFLFRGRRQRIDLGETKATQTLQRKRSGGAVPITAAIETDLTRIKGLGPRAAAQLSALGYGSIAALATLDDAAVDALDARLGTFSGRATQDRWVEQARLLNAGDIAVYEAQFGKIGDEG